VTLTPTDDGYRARLTGTQSSGVLRSMVAADGLAIVTGNTTIPPDSPVKVLLLRPNL
jgi:molybdopterin biosynthesis enzyme